MRNGFSAYAAVAAGGAVGSVMRWGAGLAFAPIAGWPWSTLFVNVSGSFLIGALAANRRIDHPLARHFMMTGLCGGYTTFSAFSLDATGALYVGDFGAAIVYAGATVAGSLLAVWLGDRAGSLV